MNLFSLHCSHFLDTRETNIICVIVSVYGDLQQRFTMFNGGFSKDQLDWLDSVLALADEKQERVTIVSK